MHGPTRVFWANLTPFSRKLDWLLLRGLRARVPAAVGAGAESDHQYVCADLELPSHAPSHRIPASGAAAVPH
jgi:hypothetical protein